MNDVLVIHTSESKTRTLELVHQTDWSQHPLKLVITLAKFPIPGTLNQLGATGVVDDGGLKTELASV